MLSDLACPCVHQVVTNQDIHNTAIENSPIFFTKMPDVFLDLTIPASNISEAGAINITMAPITRSRTCLPRNLTELDLPQSLLQIYWAILPLILFLQSLSGPLPLAPLRRSFRHQLCRCLQTSLSLNNLFLKSIIYCRFNLHLRQKIYDVFGSAIQFQYDPSVARSP